MLADFGSVRDPYILQELQSQPLGAFKNSRGKTLSSPRPITGQSTKVIVIAGQSNCCNSTPTRYNPTNASKVDNLNIYDGGVYVGADPLLGCHNTVIADGGGNIFTRMADGLVTYGVCDRVVLIPVGQGGTTIFEWNAVLKDRIVVGKKRAAALGFNVDAVLWMQGETDNVNGMSQTDYQQGLSTLISSARASGVSAPWLLGKSTFISGAASPAIRSAVDALVDGMDIFAGADTDTLTGANRRTDDNTHFSDAGAAAAAGLWAAAVDAVF